MWWEKALGAGGGGGWGWVINAGHVLAWWAWRACAKGSDGLRKGSLKFLLLGRWDSLLEGLRAFGIRTLYT